MQLIIFVGGQASGKSTFFKQYFADTHIRINLDMLKTRHREKLIFEACLNAKQKCVIDNTNPTLDDRKRYVDLAKQAGFEIVCYYFHSDLKNALKRNSEREGKACIPEIGVRATYKKIKIPQLSEGFEIIYQVKILQGQEFSISILDQINNAS